MQSALDQRNMLLDAWRTNNRVTTFLVCIVALSNKQFSDLHE